METTNLKICIILGTRPEIIKMAPLIRECHKRGLDYFILHTGQHYDEKMDTIFFRDLDIVAPKHNLNIGNQPYRKQVGVMVKEISLILQKEKPDIVIVQGDTISVLAGALAASKLGIKVAHHEAGLRSRDTSMLEEINRVIVDHISDFLMAPTKDAMKNLRQEGRPVSKMFLTGNTIVDAVRQNLKTANAKVNILAALNLKKKKYILLTCHRAENVDKKEKLENILQGALLVHENIKLPIIFPLHPRTRKNLAEFKITLPEGLVATEPLGFFEFLQLEKNARLILTDSGGVQEEAFILKVPCVTLRENTERPETVKAGVNLLTGTHPQKILESARKMMQAGVQKKFQENPFGNGTAAKKIVQIIVENT